MSDIDYLNRELIDSFVRSNNNKNCPNCGAPIESEKCGYCGSIFIDFACMDTDKPFYLKIKHKGNIQLIKVMLTQVHMSRDVDTLYCDNTPIISVQSTYRELSMNFIVL